MVKVAPHFVPTKMRKPQMLNLNNNQSKKLVQEDFKSWDYLIKRAKYVSKWLHLQSGRRCSTAFSKRKQAKNFQKLVSDESLSSCVKGIGSDCDSSDDEDETYGEKLTGKFEIKKKRKSYDQTLIIYFSKLATSKFDDDKLDLDFIESLVENGANINATDRYGQTIFHEVARIWHPDVVLFLLALKANINQADKYGRTPLHVAAAVNYFEMVKVLIENGADPKLCTYGEGQTPVHYAAKNDATDALKFLLKLGCDKETCDSRGRSPLYVAAELDRSETALYLVECNAKVGVVDCSGQSAMTLMIEKMPPVALKALDGFHRRDRANRKQYFDLHLLEPVLPGDVNLMAKTPIQAIIQHKQMNLLLHPVFQRLLKVQWKQFARRRHLKQLLLSLLFVVLWSTYGLTTPSNSVSEYNQSWSKIWWRVVVESFAVAMTLFMILLEIYEWRASTRYHFKWQEWRANEIEKDIEYCHPQWPEERKYINLELDRIYSSKISYFNDFWNIIDWITYVWIIGGVVARIIALNGNKDADLYHKRILSISMIIIWVRMLKLLRAFQLLGPFIVMLGHILVDTFKFFAMFITFFIPYVFAFWIMFGGSENAALMEKNKATSAGWKRADELIYSVFMVTVVGDINFDGLLAVDQTMARILVSTCIACCGILLLNLFIALLSDTFQRVYDNARANALMEKAIAINNAQLGMGNKSKNKFRTYIHRNCAPEELYYDDDDNEGSGELEKMTIQIKDVVDDIQELLENNLTPNNILPNDTKRNNSLKLVTKNGGNNILSELQTKVDQQSIALKNMEKKMVEMFALLNHNLPSMNTKSSSDSEVNTLPSIFELKPDLFRQSNSRNEQTNDLRV